MTQQPPTYNINNWLKWLANGCFIIATISLLNPHTASTSVSPWVLYMIGNAVWMVDSWGNKNWPWFWLSFFFVGWDTLLILSRVSHFSFSFLGPIMKALEMLP